MTRVQFKEQLRIDEETEKLKRATFSWETFKSKRVKRKLGIFMRAFFICIFKGQD